MVEIAETSKPAVKGKSQRNRIWEINPRFHCSLIGTCIQINDLKQVTKRYRIHFDDDSTDYCLHSAYVNMADISSPALRMLQKLVDRQYANEIRAFSRLKTPEELESLWYEYLDGGKIAGAYWALMSHPSLTRELANRAHGEIHMLSHKASISHQADLQLLAEHRVRCKTLEKQLFQLNQGLRETVQERDTALEKLKIELRYSLKVNKRLEQANQRVLALESDEKLQNLLADVELLKLENENLRRRAGKAETERDNYRHKLDTSEGKNQTLVTALRELRQKHQHASRLADLTPAQTKVSPPCHSHADAAEHLDLCGRCVLVVGGRTGQCEHYRTLVEKHNGRFIHHDGGREDSRQRLGTIMQRADAVLCPLDSISHDAINRVKRFCEQNTKHLVLMPRSSLSTFAQSLRQVAK